MHHCCVLLQVYEEFYNILWRFCKLKDIAYIALTRNPNDKFWFWIFGCFGDKTCWQKKENITIFTRKYFLQRQSNYMNSTRQNLSSKQDTIGRPDQALTKRPAAPDTQLAKSDSFNHLAYNHIFLQLRSDDQSNWQILLRLPAKRGQHPHADAFHVPQNEESLHVHHSRWPAGCCACVQNQSTGFHSVLDG